MPNPKPAKGRPKAGETRTHADTLFKGCTKHTKGLMKSHLSLEREKQRDAYAKSKGLR